MSTPFATLVERLNRRTLLKLGVSLGALVGVAVGGGAFALLRPRTIAATMRVLTDDEIVFLDAAAESFFPPGNALGVDVATAFVPQSVDAFLDGQSDRVLTLFHAVMSLFEAWPQLTLSSTKSFSALTLEARIATLRQFDESRFEGRRGLLSLIRLLVSNAVFELPEARLALGFRGGCDGIPTLLPGEISSGAGTP